MREEQILGPVTFVELVQVGDNDRMTFMKQVANDVLGRSWYR